MSDSRSKSREEKVQHIRVNFRPMGIRDLEKVQALYMSWSKTLAKTNVFEALEGHVYRIARMFKEVRQSLMMAQRYVAYVAVYEEEILGYGTGIIEERAPIFQIEVMGSIAELFVKPAYRGQGLGTRLVELILEDFRQRGIQWIDLEIPGNNPKLKQFFQKWSFQTYALKMSRFEP